jgi:hypothetical protein
LFYLNNFIFTVKIQAESGALERCFTTKYTQGHPRTMVDKKSLSERDICTKYITPIMIGVGWDMYSQIREEVSFTKGRIIGRGKLRQFSSAKAGKFF